MKTDISTTADIRLLVDSFYERVREDDIIGHFFTEVAAVNWDEHLPVMYGFWSSILLGEGQYRGRLIMKHLLLSQKSPIEKGHLERWQQLFLATLDQLYEGGVADEAKRRVHLMGELMMFKLERAKERGFIQ